MLADGVDDVALDIGSTEGCRSYAVKELQDVALLLSRIEEGNVRLDALGVEVELVLEHLVELVIEHERGIDLLADSIRSLIAETADREEGDGSDGGSPLPPFVHLGRLGCVQDVIKGIRAHAVQLLLGVHDGVLDEVVDLLVLVDQAPHLTEVLN